MTQNILVTTDLSDESLEGVRQANELAKSLDASLTLLHVSELSQVPLDALMRHADPANIYKKQMMERFETQLKSLHTELLEDRPNTHHKLIDGRTTWKAITDYAEKNGHDLIVLGSRGRSTIERVLLGSVTERVVRHAHCSVLTVRAT